MQNRTTMFNPTTGKECKVNNIYGQTAKQCYQGYIDSFGWEPTKFMPEGMTYKNGRFNTKQVPMTSETGIRGMIVNTTLDNVFGLKGFKGLNLLNWFKPTIKAFIEQHGGCTRQFAVLVQLEKLAK